MPTHSDGAGRRRYIVRSSDASQMIAFINGARLDPGIDLIDAIGPPGQVHTVVVAMDDDKARALELQFRTMNNQLTIEPDRPLSMFGDR